MTREEDLYRQGSEILDKDPGRAVILFTESLEIAPDSPPALYNRIAALARLGRDREAMEDVERLELLAPDLGKQIRRELMLSADPYLDIAHLHYEKGEYQLAVEKCESALVYDPLFADALVGKGAALFKLHMAEAAMECYNQALQIEPENFYACLNRGELRCSLRQFALAIDDLSRAIELRPSAPVAFSFRADAFDACGNAESAAADRARALELRAASNLKP